MTRTEWIMETELPSTLERIPPGQDWGALAGQRPGVCSIQTCATCSVNSQKVSVAKAINPASSTTKNGASCPNTHQTQ
ncbi:unnamed protein product [Caretta caretta]